MPHVERVEVIRTAPDGARLTVVKVHTSEPGLYGVGCASLCLRDAEVARAVQTLAPLAVGRDVHRIEDFWATAINNSYWRNGPVLNAAVSGIDMALWDIVGKLAGLPVYQLFGGKLREGAAVYRHAYGDSPEEIADDVLRLRADGARYVRIPVNASGEPAGTEHRTRSAPDGTYLDPLTIQRTVVRTLRIVHERVGDAAQLLCDVHERLPPADAIRLAKAVEPFELFFLEDPLPPEHSEWFQQLRSQAAVPLAMGELWANPTEWIPLVKNQLIDFVRAHLSVIGGLTPARRMAAFCDVHGVRTAWHGPGDVSPIGHAANLHLDLAAPNFGIQETGEFSAQTREVFPGAPTIVDGYTYLNEAPGLGVDIDVAAAARFPVGDGPVPWPMMRRPDGSPTRF